MKHTEEDRLLSVAEAGERLALTESGVRAWILRRKIGYVKIGRRVKIPLSEVLRLREENFVPAREVPRA